MSEIRKEQGKKGERKNSSEREWSGIVGMRVKNRK